MALAQGGPQAGVFLRQHPGGLGPSRSALLDFGFCRCGLQSVEESGGAPRLRGGREYGAVVFEVERGCATEARARIGGWIIFGRKKPQYPG